MANLKEVTPDATLQYMRVGTLVSIQLRNLSDMELHQVILGLWSKLGNEAKIEVVSDLSAAIQGLGINSPIIWAFKESTENSGVIDLDKFMPRGGIQPRKAKT